ncbi:MAG: nitroreductase family protein [Clostridia bacterium]|nr:nitroreductase family protein [Clostridia bacterium]
MDFFDTVNLRGSYRWKYEDTPVPREDLRRIIEAGLAAPSGCNLQTTHIVGVDDPELMKKLGGLLDKGYFATAPAAIVVFTRVEEAFGGVSYNVQDYSAAIQNMLLAISALGYASCWVEGYVTGYAEVAKGMAELLGAPEEYSAVAFLPVGVPASDIRRAPKKSFEERAGFNGFSGGI